MGGPSKSLGSAPPYSALDHEHPSQSPFPGSSTIYIPDEAANDPPIYPDSESATLLESLPPAHHTHCQECARDIERKHRREDSKACCANVTAVFIVLIVCLFTFLLGAAYLKYHAEGKKRKDGF